MDQKILKLGKKLWPLNRSITGEGVNQTLKILKVILKNLGSLNSNLEKKFLIGLSQMNGKLMKHGLKIIMEKR